jgi:CubicO group peptidase (beta-lactamase class C family)
MNDYNWEHHSGYGYGLGVRTMTDKAAGGSNSNVGEFGWSGMLGTYVLMDPAVELTYVYAQQLMPSKEEYVAPRLRNVVYACL